MAGRSRYERELRRRVRDAALWPSFSSPEFLERLERVALRALSRRTADGDVAAVLIYHQLVEEMLSLLIQDCQFQIQLSLWPSEVRFRIRQRQMFGQLQQLLLDSIEFPGKERFLRDAGRLNTIRIEVVHHLAKRGSLRGLRRLALRARSNYERCFSAFDVAHDEFRVVFKDFRKDVFEENAV